MNCSTVQLLDLPDEMLIEIFKKLTNIDVVYSIMGVNKRLARLACDPIVVEFLDLTSKTPFGERCSMPDVMLDRFCSLILPQVHDNIKSLLVEPSSMKRILLACNYPNLHKLTLKSIKLEAFINYLADDSCIVHIFKKITHLVIFTIEYYNTISQMKLNTHAYTRLFSVCQRLTHLRINGKYFHLDPWTQGYSLPLTMCSSSIIIELNVNVLTINDCLRLLDGRFDQMKTFIVKVDFIKVSSLNIDNEKSLPNLATFSLNSIIPTEEYDNLIVPMLQRMPNIEKLTLYLNIENRSKFIDDSDLYNNIIIYMPRITTFTFNITTINDRVDIKYWFKNDEIRDSFITDNEHSHFHCHIDYFTNGIGRCRISSYPFSH